LASIGSLFCWVFFPFLNWDIPVQFIYSNQAAINTLYCITASVITCACISCLFYGQMSLKDVVYSPVVGGVIVGSSAAMINNSAGALILGMVAGIVHTLLQRW
jgi:ammonia channel protein AmtB